MDSIDKSTDKSTDKSSEESRFLMPVNPEDKSCYCGEDRNYKTCEFQCGMCLCYYHEKCITCDIGECVPFMTNYQFFCKRCSTQESFEKKPASFGQMCLTALANLMQLNPERTAFSKDNEIVPYIETYWDQLTSVPRRVKNTWHASITKTMLKDQSIFFCKDEKEVDQKFGLVNEVLSKIGPNCESLFRLTSSRPMENKQPPPPPENKSRTAKRRAPAETNIYSNSKQRKGDSHVSMKLAPSSYPQEHPFNKDGYRYHLAEPDPHAPNWQAFDESNEWAGKPIPGYLYRINLEARVMLSLHDRAQQLKISDERLTVTGEKGYSMVRATHGLNNGCWYYEVTIDDMPQDSATRIGWSQALGNLQAPCGYDKFSYSWRSRKGTVFHQSKGKHFSDGYKEGDVLGFFISMPTNSTSKMTPAYYKDKPLVKFKSHLYYEEKDYVTESEKKLHPLKNSQMIMYRNGKYQGIAFEDVYEGTYFPAISIYKNATVTVNFGPKFSHHPRGQHNYKAVGTLAEEANVQHAIGDILYHIEHDGQPLQF